MIGFMCETISRFIMKLAVRGLTDGMKEADGEWAKALTHEYLHIDDPRKALGFAIGCLSAAYKAS